MKRMILTLIAGITLFFLLSGAVFAAPTFTEQENNNDRGTAQVLCMNAPLIGVLSDDSNENGYDVDWYRIIVPKSGSIIVNLHHDYIDSSNTVLTLGLYWPDSDSQIWSADSKGNKADSTYDTFYLDQGEYDLALTAKQRSALNYSLLVSYAEEPNSELEYNNDPGSATEIRPNENRYGALTTRDDVDFYTLTLDEPGKVSMQFIHEYFDDNSSRWEVELSMGIADTLIRSFTISGKNSDFCTFDFFLNAGKYTIKVKTGYYYSSQPYTLLVNFEPDPNIERESNDQFTSATEIGVNTEIHGALTNDDDIDFYRFELDSPGEIILKHKHEYFDDGSRYFVISMYNDTKSDALLFTDNLTGRDSDFTRHAVYLPAGVYYLQYKDYYNTDRPYAFMLEFTPNEKIEHEWNNDYGSATSIQTNTVYKGSLMTDRDIDFYSFTIDELSELHLEFSFEYIDDSSRYFEIFLDTGMNDNLSYITPKLSGKDNSLFTEAFFLPEGTYYLRVGSYYHTARPYSLNIHAAPFQSAEREWNNKYADATPITLGQPVWGSFGYDGDTDYYVLNIGDHRSITIDLQHEWFDDSSTYWNIAIDPEPGSSNRLYTMKVKGNDTEMRSDPIEVFPGTYYISVTDYYFSNRPYMLNVR